MPLGLLKLGSPTPPSPHGDVPPVHTVPVPAIVVIVPPVILRMRFEPASAM